jgi:hypothetical protein
VEFQKRDQIILDSLIEEYQKKQIEEESEVKQIMRDKDTILAHLVYNTG